MITEKGDVTTSYLLIQRAKSLDSGKYVCAPSNAMSSSINIHVLNGNLIVQYSLQLALRPGFGGMRVLELRYAKANGEATFFRI